MKRLVFTFGTLYEEKIIHALLGHIPEHFFATLKQYAVYRGDERIVPEEVKHDLVKNGRDLSTFKFLFAKKDNNETSVIEGKVYTISTFDELILDWWERYPIWYRKEDVSVQDTSGKHFNAFMYAIDKEGEKLESFMRDPNNDVEKTAFIAQKFREKVKQEFPLAGIS